MQKLQYQISPRPLQINSQSVRVKALNNVVRSTTPEEKEPSCPMFFAMTKQVTVLADPSMIMMETSLSFVKSASDGKGQKKSFITDQFHKGTGDGCFEPGKSFPKMKRSTHGHETKRSSSFGKIAYGRVQDLRKGKAKKRPECTGNNTENDGIGDNAF